MKRIYWETIKKWAIKAGIPAGIAGFSLLFIYLSFLGVIEITGHSGDMICQGTIEDPCYAYINFTAKEDIFIYPTDYDPWGRNTPFETDKKLKSWKMYRSWGTGWREIKLNDTCTGTWCGAPNNLGVKYSFVFRKGRDYQIRIVAYKNHPFEDIKWGFTDELDPAWLGVANFTLIDNTDNCLIDCEAHVRMEVLSDFVLKREDIAKYCLKDKDANDLSSLGFQIWKEEELVKQKWISNVSCNPYNETTVNGTMENPNCTDYGYNVNKTYYQIIYDDFPNEIDFEEGDVYYFEIKGKKNARLGENNIDWKLNISGYELPWAWWNSSWIKKKELSNLTGEGTADIVYLNITYDSDMQADFDDIRFVDNATESIEYGYFLQDKVNSAWAVFRILSRNESAIYMYYDNDAVSTTSDIFDVYGSNLTSAYFLERTSGDVVDGTGDHNGTNYNAIRGVDGKIGNAYDFDGTADYVNINDSDDWDATDGISISGWFYADSLGVWNAMINQWDSTAAASSSWTIETVGADFRFYIYDGAGLKFASSAGTAVTGRWIFVVGVYEGDGETNGLKIYVNNTLGGTTATITTANTAAFPLRIGDFYDTINAWDGRIDDVLIYRGAINSTRRDWIYNTQEPTYVLGSEESSDEIFPVATLNSPIDNYNSSSQTIIFNGTAYDNLNLTNVSLYGNWTGTWQLNETNSSPGNNTPVIFTKNISDGLGYIWNYYACDWLSQCNFSAANRTFNVDTTYPIISIDYPENITYAVNVSELNFSYTETSPSRCWYSKDGGSTNLSVQVCTSNFTNVVSVEGNNTWTVYINDTSGNENSSSVTFFKDTIYPSLSVVYPVNNSYLDLTYLNITGTASDTNSDTIYINDTNFGNNLGTYTNWNFTNASMAEGSYSVQVSANDTLNNTNSSVLNFVIDRTNPSIYFNPNTDSGYVDRNWIFVNITATDTNLHSVRLEWNGTNETFDNSGDDLYWENQTSLSDGNYTFYAWANDSAGHYNFTATRNVNIDTTNPLIEFTTGTESNDSSFDRDWIFANVSVTESNFANITFRLYNSTSEVNSTTYTTEIFQINWTGLPGEFYYYNVTVRDTASRSNTTETRKITLSHLRIFFEGVEGDANVELGAEVNLSVNSTANITICVDIDHPDYGINYSCGNQTTTFELLIDYFRKILFNDSSTSKTFNYTGFDIQNFSISSHQYDEADNLTVNISGVNALDVRIYGSNTSTYDRVFHGILNGSNIYLNKLYDESNTTNITYSNPGESTVYFWLDDNIDSYTFFLNATGIEYGFTHEDNFDDFDNMDTILTTAHLDKSGAIMPANSSLKEFSFDDFEDDSIADYWLKTDDFSYTDQCTLQRTTSETGGYIQQLNYQLDASSKCGGSSTMELAPNITYMNLYDSEDVTFNLYSTYGSTGDPSGCAGNTYVEFGGTNVWTSSYLIDFDSNQNEGSAANMTFTLTKENKTHWKVDISGLETTSRGITGSGCGTETKTYYWTNGTWYYFTDHPATCPGDSGSLDNSFYVAVSHAQLAMKIWNYMTFTTLCIANTVNTRTYWVNNSLWSRSNSTVYSKSIFDSSSDISSATLTLYGASASDESLGAYMSADDGVNWEAVSTGVEHAFSNPGKHVKWAVDFILDEAGYRNKTTRITSVSVVTQAGNVTNLTFDFGGDGTIDFNISGELNSTNSPYTINLSSADISDAFTSARQDYAHLYRIPLVITTDTKGQLNLDAINLTYNPNPISLNTDYIQRFLGNSTGFIDFSIPVGSTGGNVTISNVKYDYAGGNQTYTILSHNEDYTINASNNLIYYYSRWDYEIVPDYTDYIEFTPGTPTSKNVSASGQDSTPIINITNCGYGSKNASLSIYLDETLSCVNLTLSSTLNKTDGFIINSSWQNITQLDYLGITSGWMWADYNCNYTTWHSFIPYLYFRQCCYDCICSEEIS